MKIRAMRAGEIEEVLQMEHKLIYPELTRPQLKKWFGEAREFKPQYFVAEKEGSLVGFAVLEPYEINGNEIVLQLDAIAVKPEHQKQDIGRELLQYSLRQVYSHWREHNFHLKGIVIETGTDEATGFYEKVFPNYQKIVFSNIWRDGEGMVFYFVPFPQSL